MERKFISGNRNPFLPLDIYIPDGEPKVFEDRVYLYGSKDYFGGEYCCHKYHTYSASVDNLYEWTDYGPILASTNEYVNEGIEDGVPWSDGLLWAPDIVKKGNMYYLYFCLSDGTEGVAESKYPYGPFTNARQIMMNGEPIKGIDPSVLQEGDEYYYTWGQGNCHMAKLLDDMCTLDPETYAEALISHENGMQGFHEGSSLRKIGEYYCIVYASEYTDAYPNRGGAPTRLDYAVSKDIYGPYERRGTIIDNTGIDPSSWNNHGSILKIKDQWYVFYHGSSNDSKYTRRSRVEMIQVDEEKGIIEQTQMTSSGFAKTLDPTEELDAAFGYQVQGGTYFTEKDDAFPLVNVKNNSSVAFRYYDFGETEKWQIKLTGKCLEGGKVTVLVNGVEKAILVCEDTNTTFEIYADIADVKGLADVKLVFTAEHEKEILELQRIKFLTKNN